MERRNTSGKTANFFYIYLCKLHQFGDSIEKIEKLCYTIQ